MPHVLVVQKVAVLAEKNAIPDIVRLGKACKHKLICAGNARDDVGGLHWAFAAQRAPAVLSITEQQRSSKTCLRCRRDRLEQPSSTLRGSAPSARGGAPGEVRVPGTCSN